jgi:hypothetical protein
MFYTGWIEPFEYSTYPKAETVSGYRIQSYASPDHSIAKPFETQKKKSGFRMASLDHFIKKRVIKKYFIYDKTV